MGSKSKGSGKNPPDRREFLRAAAVRMSMAVTVAAGSKLAASSVFPAPTGPGMSAVFRMSSNAPFESEIVRPENASDIGVKVRMGPPSVVMLAPEGDTQWGLFMFPSIWWLRDGRLVCAVTMGADEMPSEADCHWPYYSSVPYAQFNSCGTGRAHITPNMPAGNWVAVVRTACKWTANSPLLLEEYFWLGR